MEHYNPKSIVDREEERVEEEFLNGGPAPAAPANRKSLSEKTK
jgi:hypothetical protein